MESNIQSGVDGFWISGGTGESVLLTDEENMRIAADFGGALQRPSRVHRSRGRIDHQ